MNLIQLIKKAFILSPVGFVRFQWRWISCRHKYKKDSRIMAVARHTYLQNYRNEVVWRLKKKYRKLLPKLKNMIDSKYDSLPHDSDGKIWVCWLQGMEQAPDIVKICYESICRQFSNREVVLITNENYADYITLPHYIVEKCAGGGYIGCYVVGFDPFKPADRVWRNLDRCYHSLDFGCYSKLYA